VQTTSSSFILDLLATLKEGSMPVRALVAAGHCFGIGGNSLRVALARLLARGRVERDARGHYRLGPGAEPMRQQVSSWRRLTTSRRSWDGSWLMIHLPTGPEAAQRRRSQQALRFVGLRPLSPSLQVRPDNLRGGVEAAREKFRGLGLEPSALVFVARGLDPESDARARRLWDVQALETAYASSLEEIERSTRRLPELSEAEGMVESFLLGGRVIRQLVLDPLLPDEILPAATRDAMVAAMRDYDRAGRRCWARFLDRYGVPHLRAPADTRIPQGASSLAQAMGGAG
jgi:phenylacetic acid degradation operon negative regulatory protein